VLLGSYRRRPPKSAAGGVLVRPRAPAGRSGGLARQHSAGHQQSVAESRARAGTRGASGTKSLGNRTADCREESLRARDGELDARAQVPPRHYIASYLAGSSVKRHTQHIGERGGVDVRRHARRPLAHITLVRILQGTWARTPMESCRRNRMSSTLPAAASQPLAVAVHVQAGGKGLVCRP